MFRPGDPSASGVVKRAAFEPVRLLNTWWSVAVTAPEEEALDFIAGFRDRWLMLAGVLGLATILAAFHLYRSWVAGREQARRVEVEKALREREVLLEAMLKNLPVDFWARDREMRCIMQSAISIQSWGDHRGGEFDAGDQDGETARQWEASNRRAMAGETLGEEVELVLPDGGRRAFHSIVAPIRDQEAIIGILGVNIDLTQRKLSEERIRAQLKEKELLLKEIHHRVKNNLQIVASLLNLQAAQARDPKVLSMFMETRGRVMSMSLVHEELYRHHDLARIDFQRYARNLGEKLRFALAQDRAVTLTVEGDEAELPIDAAVPCGLILNELLTNAFKHGLAGRENGAVRAGIEARDGEFTLFVEDDGAGFPEGWDPERSESLGMQIVSALAGQLHGRLEIRRAPGTRACVIFPRP